MKYKIEIEKKYTNWKIIEDKPYYKDNDSHRFVKCECICGYQSLVRLDQLEQGLNKGCIECCYQYKRRTNKTIGLISSGFINDIRSNAKQRNLEFSLTLQSLWDLWNLQKGKCALSGIELDIVLNQYENGKPDRTKITASIDRINPYLGYTPDNVQWVHKWINIMKGALSNEDFIKICNTISNFNTKIMDNIEPSSMKGHMQRHSVYRSREGATHSK